MTRKSLPTQLLEDLFMVRPAGIEPAHPVPETGALSPELRAQNVWNKKHYSIWNLRCPINNV